MCCNGAMLMHCNDFGAQVMLFPAADPNDGLLDLVLVGPMGPIEALTVRSPPALSCFRRSG